MARLVWFSCVLGGFIAACGIGVVGERVVPGVDASPDEAGAITPLPPPSDASLDVGLDVDAADASTDGSPYNGRVTTGLLAFYDFEENTGETAHDTIAPPADVAFSGSPKPSWVMHGVHLKNGGFLVSAANVDKIQTSYKAKSELSVEAWFVPDSSSGDDYGRLVTMSSDSQHRAFALGTREDNYFWSSLYYGQGDITPDTTTNAVNKQMTHLVMTATKSDPDSQLRLYVDGAVVGLLSGLGKAADFPTYKLAIGNVPDETNKWIGGDVHLVAIYDHALTQAEITQNFQAGPNP